MKPFILLMPFLTAFIIYVLQVRGGFLNKFYAYFMNEFLTTIERKMLTGKKKDEINKLFDELSKEELQEKKDKKKYELMKALAAYRSGFWNFIYKAFGTCQFCFAGWIGIVLIGVYVSFFGFQLTAEFLFTTLVVICYNAFASVIIFKTSMQ